MKYRNTMRQNNTHENSQAIAAAGAIDLRGGDKVYLTNAAAALANTLADGLFDGQEVRIKCVATGGGSNVLTPANLTDGATLTFDAVGERTDLAWYEAAGAWEIMYNTATLA